MADDKARLKKKKPSGGGRTSPDAPMSVPEGYMNGRKKEKEKVVKGMKKNKSDFKKRYGKDAESVMYATATNIAKEKA